MQRIRVSRAKEERTYADLYHQRPRRRPGQGAQLGDASWLTVASADQPEGTELLLEPDSHPAVKPFKKALVEDGIPYTSFDVDDVRAEFDRLKARGVRFTQDPTEMGGVTTAVFDYTCGNLNQIAQMS